MANRSPTTAREEDGHILVGGAFVDRSENAPLATDLAERFTVYNYDRRGRGQSDDTQPYAVDREIEDLQALIAEAGGSAYLYGVSSGGALVLEAAAAGVAVDKLAVYEVPYTWPMMGRSGSGNTWRRWSGCSPRAVAATPPSCSCGWRAPPRR
jgi:pimeloyl-ACP methyl ester carboxylesterase